MKCFRFLILVVLVTSCDPPPEMLTPYMPSRMSLVNDVTNKTIIKLKTEKNLRACGVGSGMMDQIRMLAISFYYYNEVDIDQARELLMTAGVEYLRAINANEKMRPFLQNYPFEPRNIEIAIFIVKPDGSEPDIGRLTSVSMHRGVLNYYVHKTGTMRLETVYKETFAEAQAKLNVLTST